jgi:hypothetical protein
MVLIWPRGHLSLVSRLIIPLLTSPRWHRPLVSACLALAAACGGSEPTAPPTLTLLAVGSLPLTAIAGSTLGDSIRVRVVDAGGNPQAHVAVAFAITAGSGTVSPASVLTDAQGRAAAQFVTDRKVGANAATATIAGAAPVSFSVTTIAGPAATIAIKERIVIVDAGQRVTPTITASDANGNVVAPTQLAYSARTASVVTFTSDGAIVGIGTGLSQTFVVASNGFVADSLLMVVTTPNGPVLESDLTRLDVAHDTTFTMPVVLDMRTSGEILGATTVSIHWDPAQFTLVSQVEGSSNVGALVNDTKTAQGVLSLSVASVTGFPGRVELRRLTFKATSVVGKAGKVQLIVGDVSGANTFTDLYARTTAVTYPMRTR